MLYNHHKLNAQSAGFTRPKINLFFMDAKMQMGVKRTRNVWKDRS